MRFIGSFWSMKDSYQDDLTERFDSREHGLQIPLPAYILRVIHGGGCIEREHRPDRMRMDLLLVWPSIKDNAGALRGKAREIRV
jgi:hypothetical protein